MNTDAVIFLREMRAAFGDTMTIERVKQVSKKQHEFIFDPDGNADDVLDNCIAFLKSTVRDWCAKKENPALVARIERYVRPRTLPQNRRMWSALMMALESSGLTRPGTNETMSKEGWHFYLRIQLGYIVGTETRYLPGGYKVECPIPQPTAAGEPHQMTVEEHSAYMTQVEQFMAEHGVQPTPFEADDYAGTMGVEQVAA